MKPLKDKDFKIGSHVLTVCGDGRYRRDGKYLGRDESVVLDAAALLPTYPHDMQVAFRNAIYWFCDSYLWYWDTEQIINYIRENWEWVKGS